MTKTKKPRIKIRWGDKVILSKSKSENKKGTAHGIRYGKPRKRVK